MVAAIAAGNPAGIAAAYDRYAAALYAYCQWMLDQPTDTADALRDTFVVAAATILDLAEDSQLRPWLYAVARREGQRLRRAVPVHIGQADTDGQSADADGLPDVRSDLKPAELLSMIRGILAELPPQEREVIELSLRHDLHDADLAEVLGVSWSRAHALTVRSRGRLEKALGALLIARTRRGACPELDSLLAEWDGHLTERARDLIAWHIEQCQTCANHRLGGLRPAALSGLVPLAPLPPELREQVLKLCCSNSPDAVAYRRRVTRREESVSLAWVSQAISLVRWARIRANPGTATAMVVVVVWVVAAVSIIALTVASSHPARAIAARPSNRPPSSSPAAVSTTSAASAPATATRSASPRPSLVGSQPQAVVPTPSGSSPAFAGPSPSPRPTRSPSPRPSKSSSPSPSPSSSRTTSPSPSSSGSASPSPSKTSQERSSLGTGA